MTVLVSESRAELLVVTVQASNSLILSLTIDEDVMVAVAVVCGLRASKSSTSAWNSELVNLLSSRSCERGGFLDDSSASFGVFLSLRPLLGEL